MPDEPSVTGTPDSSASTAAASQPAQGTASGTPSSSADVNTQAVQGETQSPPDDPLAGFPEDSVLEKAVADKVPWAEMASRLKGAYTPLKTDFTALTEKYKPFEAFGDRFESGEQLQEVVNLYDNLFQYSEDPESHAPIANTEAAATWLHEQRPAHASDLFASLAEMPVFDQETGRTMPRWEVVLHGAAQDPEQKAIAARILGLVEPSANAPQWQPTQEELNVVRPDLQDTYRNLPYEDREELKLASPEFINRTLEREQLAQQLQQTNAESERLRTEETQRREAYINEQAQVAGNNYVGEQLNQALTTFFDNVVQQSNFIEPIDPQKPPEGMSAQDVVQMNAEIKSANENEAVMTTAVVIGLLNPQVRAFILPLLQQNGIVDQKFLQVLDDAANGFGNNARTYGNITYRQRLQSNGTYQPGQDVVTLQNEAKRNLQRVVSQANVMRAKLMEKRGRFFELKALGHGQTLNSVSGTRPPINGQGYNPITAPASSNLPSRKLTRSEIEAQFG